MENEAGMETETETWMGTSLAPPPTPIATGKGAHTSAINDADLTKFLDNSLKVPDLSLPNPFPCSIKHLHRKIPSGIDLRELRAGEETAVRRLLAAATGTGAFRIDGHGLSAEDVRDVIKLTESCGVAVGGISEEGRWIGKVDSGVREELCWSGPVVEEETAAGGNAPVTETYRVLREKLEKLSMNLEAIAKTISEAILTHVKNPSLAKKSSVNPEGYLLYLKKHELHHQEYGIPPAVDDELDSTDHDYPSHALSLHITLECHEFRLLSQEGSNSYSVPGGSLIVTIGRPLQEWSNGELKGVIGKPVFDTHVDPNPSFSLEFMCSPALPANYEERTLPAHPLKHSLPANSLRRGLPAKSISLTDQVLMVLVPVIAVLFGFWVLDSSRFA